MTTPSETETQRTDNWLDDEENLKSAITDLIYNRAAEHGWDTVHDEMETMREHPDLFATVMFFRMQKEVPCSRLVEVYDSIPHEGPTCYTVTPGPHGAN